MSVFLALKMDRIRTTETFFRPAAPTSPPPNYDWAMEATAPPPPYEVIQSRPLTDLNGDPKIIYRFEDLRQMTSITCSPLYLKEDGTRDDDLWTLWFNRPETTEDTDLRAMQLLHEGPPPPSTMAWTKCNKHWYHYTSAKVRTKGNRKDPNVLLAIRMCPDLRHGTLCLDPEYDFWGSNIIRDAIRDQKKPLYFRRAIRTFDFWWNEVQGRQPRPQTAATALERRIPLEWKPCYEMHRSQRIMAKDPFLSLIEIFVLRMVMANQQQINGWENLLNEAEELFALKQRRETKATTPIPIPQAGQSNYPRLQTIRRPRYTR
jgi:hypothetical protein